jgi:hypothetical protein
MTVAYRPTDRGAVEISTSLCKAGDTFSRKMGCKTAVENFIDGHTIFLPVNKKIGELRSIIRAFMGFDDARYYGDD